MTDHDFEERLRATLSAQATHAPDHHPVVQQVLHDVEVRRARPVPRWRAWTVPLVAAGAVAAVAAAVVGVENFHPSAHHAPPATQVTPPPTISTAPAPTSPAPRSTATHPVVPNTLGLTNFTVSDLTWVGPDSGWALGTADCLRSTGTCVAMARTTDGKTWHSVPNPPVNIGNVNGCAAPCATEVRFANDQIGYVFGLSTFFMTTDGGASWHRQPGGASALETLDGNVIRVSTSCSPGCPYLVQTAPIGTTSWATRALPGSQPNMATGAVLVRVAGSSYLDVFGHVSGGASNATSVFFISNDGGATWVDKGEPCPQTGGGTAGNEVDSTRIAAGGSSLAMICTPRGSTTSFAIVSSDGGMAYRRGAGLLAGAGQLAVSGPTLLAGTTTGLYRSTDSGDTWHQVDVPGLGSPRWLGFETPAEGRVVSADGSTIWTTRDAGAHWST
ncbi:MAG: Sortilin, neurotensin receptor 3 [Pseudonocardiales bacterium]|jgi:hypothetical protein|nr:Sortilin, neurotensin receptor 3 [Pseudonocardiales bacterium]